MLLYFPSPDSNLNSRQKSATGKLCSCVSRKIIDRAGHKITLLELTHRTIGWIGFVPSTDTFVVSNAGKMTAKVRLAWAMRKVAAKHSIIAKRAGGDSVNIYRRRGDSAFCLPGNKSGTSKPSPLEELGIAADHQAIMGPIHDKACEEGLSIAAANNSRGKVPASRAATREKHKKIKPIGNDVAERHWKAVLNEILSE